MAIENEVWSEIKITVGTKDIEVAGNIANMVVPYGIYIEDYSDLENEVMEIAHIDLIEESLLEADRSKGIIHVYVNPHENPIEAVSFIEERLKEQNIEYSIQIDDCATEDWVNNWKQYFHPMPIGEKLLIRPTWEDEYDAGGRKVLHIEPGLAFGTGSHPTTKLCLETLEKYIDENSTVLDIGCGSGILSIASLLLGAKNAFGVVPALLAGVILAGILASTMSTADSQLLAASSAASENIIGGLFRIKLSETAQMIVARVTLIAISVIGVVIAWDSNSSVFGIVSFAWAGFGAVFGPVMLLSLFWKRSNRYGALAGMIVGGVMVFVWKNAIAKLGGVFDIYELLPAFICGLLVNVIVSLLTPKPEKEITEVFDELKNSK